MFVEGLLTESGEKTTRFILFGDIFQYTRGGVWSFEWMVVDIDMKPILGNV